VILRRASQLLAICYLAVIILAHSVEATDPVWNNARMKHMWSLHGDVIWALNPTSKAVALTFDDGPNPFYTHAMLQVLDQYKAKATFFMIGERALQFPSLVQEVLQSGHQIGVHGFAHKNMAVLNEQAIRTDLSKAETVLHSLGVEPTLFRPPMGELSPTLVTIMRARGYRVVMWSWTQDTRDWTGRNSASIAADVLKNVRGGDIILLHDGTGNRQRTLEALKLILAGLKERDFHAVTVDQLRSMPQLPSDDHSPLRGP
jgi:peptidoglycan/xylan/chitin deacetylase (PgdA/CDA1 family)